MVQGYIAPELIDAEFTEIESGRKKDRPELNKALELCKEHDATLLIAKLDRLARNVHFISALRDAKVKFVAVDMPEANDTIITILSAFAEAEAKAKKDGGVKKLIGVKVIGMTTCPCAKEVIRKIGKYNNNDVPPTHNQRNITTLMIEVPSEDKSVDANDLIDITEKSFSSPTYGILKRDEEGEIVFNAHKNPKFVEDVVRDILRLILKKYSNLPDDVLVIVRSESEESIHKHNAFAERITSLAELRK